jgi:hypothetical protein
MFAQGLPERYEMDTKRALVDSSGRPPRTEQLILRNNFPGFTDQRDQQLQSFLAKLVRSTRLSQFFVENIELKGAELYNSHRRNVDPARIDLHHGYHICMALRQRQTMAGCRKASTSLMDAEKPGA